MLFDKSVEETLRDMLNSDPAFKEAFEHTIKSKVLDALEDVNFSSFVKNGIENMIDYMFTSDDYIYESVKESITNSLKSNIRINMGGKEFELDDE